jgi:hypothetical protein
MRVAGRLMKNDKEDIQTDTMKVYVNLLHLRSLMARQFAYPSPESKWFCLLEQSVQIMEKMLLEEHNAKMIEWTVDVE